MDLVHRIKQKDAVLALIVNGGGLLYGLEVPQPDPSVTSNGDQLSLRHHELLNRTLVASGEIPSTDFNLHLGKVFEGQEMIKEF